MADLSNIFAGMLGGAASGYADVELDRIQMNNRVQASQAIRTREASLKAIAARENNEAFISRLSALPEEDQGMLQDRLGENWQERISTTVEFGGVDEGLSLLNESLEREEDKSTGRVGDETAAKISERMGIPVEEFRMLSDPVQMNQLHWLQNKGKTDADGNSILTDTEIAVAEATNQLGVSVNRIVPDGMDQAFNATYKPALMNNLAQRIEIYSKMPGATIDRDVLLSKAMNDATSFLADNPDDTNVWEAFLEQPLPTIPEPEPEPEAVVAPAAEVVVPPAQDFTRPLDLDEVERDMQPQAAALPNLPQLAETPPPPARERPQASVKSMAPVSPRQAALARAVARPLQGASEAQRDSMAANIISRQMGVLRGSGGSPKAAATAIRAEDPRGFATLQYIASNRNLTVEDLIRYLYDDPNPEQRTTPIPTS